MLFRSLLKMTYIPIYTHVFYSLPISNDQYEHIDKSIINPLSAKEFFVEFFHENWICYSPMVLKKIVFCRFSILGWEHAFFDGDVYVSVAL